MKADRHVQIQVKLRAEILDPQGDAVLNALHSLGIGEVKNVRIGKVIDLYFPEQISPSDAQNMATQAGEKLLANPVIEEFTVELK